MKDLFKFVHIFLVDSVYFMSVVPGRNEVPHVIHGNFDVGTQYHFTMETQQCVCVPTEDGMDVYPSTQWMDLTQIGIAKALGVPENR
jgi:xanthine dehydrogenase/oxidase